MPTRRGSRGFYTLPVRISCGKHDYVHHLYVKEHCLRKENKLHPRGRTLFVANLPPDPEVVDCASILAHFFSTVIFKKTIRICWSSERGVSKYLLWPSEQERRQARTYIGGPIP